VEARQTLIPSSDNKIPAAVDRVDLRERADRLHRMFEERFYDPRGLMYAYINLETFRPFTAREVRGYPLKVACAPEDWLGYENSAMVAGNYLSALCNRAKVEPGGETEAMTDRAGRSLQRLCEMNSAFREPGWLGKPHGGRAGTESTNDQYGAAILGLRDLARLDNGRRSREAGRWAVALCDFWMRHDYRLFLSDGRMSHRWMGRHQWGLVSMTFIRIAYELTHDEKYAVETERLRRQEQCDQPSPRAGNFLHNAFADRPGVGVRRLSAYHHLVSDALEALCDAWPQRHEDWHHLLMEFWRKDIAMGLDADGLAYACYEVDMATNQWRPIAAQYLFPAGTTRENAAFPHQFWVGRCKSGSMTCHVAASAVKVGRCVPALRDECRRLAFTILQRVDENAMAMIIDPEGDQECPEFGGIRKKMLDGRGVAQWLRAYWQGLDLGWW
jgi:hypothetical protein